MRPLALLILSALLAACGGCGSADPAATRIEPEPSGAPAVAAAPVEASAAPWAVRSIRSCSEWAGSSLLATNRHLFACDGAVFDTESGRLQAAGFDLSWRLAADARHSLWTDPERDELVVRDEALAERRTGPESLPSRAAFSADGRSVVIDGVGGIRILDLASLRVERPDEAARCADTTLLGFTRDGRVQCVIEQDGETRLVTLSEPDAPPIPAVFQARWVPGRGLLVTRSADAIRWISEDGETLAERAATREHGLLDVRDDGSALITTAGDQRGFDPSLEGATERWWVQDGEVQVESLYGRAAEQGTFVGETQVALARLGNVVWLHRGPALARPSLPMPDPPAGYVAYRATNERTFEGQGGTFPRAPHDVAAFGGADEHHGYLRVSRSDADELANFEALDAWGRAAMARYVEVGTERWAKVWRDDGGERVLRGHSYIGGCERTHIDVFVRERGATLERWVAMHGEPTTDGPFATTPESARDVDDSILPRYAGDPSTGPIR